MAAHWVLKTEPEVFSWADLVRDGQTRWDGIRNFQARNNLKKMKVGDHCFFYHSGEERQIVGLAKVVKEAYPDPTAKAATHRLSAGGWVCVDIAPVSPSKKPLPLALLKESVGLGDLALVKQGRLSVSPVTAAEAKIILHLSK